MIKIYLYRANAIDLKNYLSIKKKKSPRSNGSRFLFSIFLFLFPLFLSLLVQSLKFLNFQFNVYLKCHYTKKNYVIKVSHVCLDHLDTCHYPTTPNNLLTTSYHQTLNLGCVYH